MTAPWFGEHSTLANVGPSAVAIKKTAANQAHVAIFYRVDGRLEKVDFCWHHRWNTTTLDGYIWIKPGWRASQGRSLAAFCRMVVQQKALDDVPFGFRFNENVKFDGARKELVGVDGQGLTCATFVLAALATLGMKLLTVEAWPARICDTAWQEEMLEYTRKLRPDLLATLAPQKGAPRFRPEEVAAGSASKRRPVGHADVLTRSHEVLNAIGASHIACQYAGEGCHACPPPPAPAPSTSVAPSDDLPS